MPRRIIDYSADAEYAVWADWNAISSYGAYMSCLLYTSDAADERSSVDLGGRRIIKKKKKVRHQREWMRRIIRYTNKKKKQKYKHDKEREIEA